MTIYFKSFILSIPYANICLLRNSIFNLKYICSLIRDNILHVISMSHIDREISYASSDIMREMLDQNMS